MEISSHGNPWVHPRWIAYLFLWQLSSGVMAMPLQLYFMRKLCTLVVANVPAVIVETAPRVDADEFASIVRLEELPAEAELEKLDLLLPLPPTSAGE